MRWSIIGVVLSIDKNLYRKSAAIVHLARVCGHCQSARRLGGVKWVFTWPQEGVPEEGTPLKPSLTSSRLIVCCRVSCKVMLGPAASPMWWKSASRFKGEFSSRRPYTCVEVNKAIDLPHWGHAWEGGYLAAWPRAGENEVMLQKARWSRRQDKLWKAISYPSSERCRYILRAT